MVTDDLQVLIVGGGIGGLSLAGFLRQGGIEPVVIERREAWDDAGYGVMLPDGGMAMLEELGIADGVRDVGNPIDAWAVRDADGTVRTRMELDDDHEVAVVHRTRLHEQLRGLVADGSLRMGTTVRSLDQSRGSVEVEFSDGVRERFDVVVGADGVHSRVRDLIGAGGAESCGTTRWTFPIDPGIDVPDEPTEVWGPDGTAFVTLPLGDRALGWLIAGAGKGEYDGFTVGDLRRVFADHGWLLPTVLDSLIADGIRHGDDYRVRTDTWVDGRVALLGDAAHAMHPVSGMGASLAMGDAYVLADELRHRRDRPAVRLRDYAGRRRSRIRKLRRTATPSPAFGFAGSTLLATIPGALAVRSGLLESVFAGGDRRFVEGPPGTL